MSTLSLTTQTVWRQRIDLRRIALDAGLPLLAFALLTLALTWPLARDFASKAVGAGDDVRHNVWLLWHVKEALLGPESLFGSRLLYYPAGISLRLHGVGPLAGLFALPFSFWGPLAAYNGTILIGFVLTGYFMYLLARGLAFSRSVALFAGLFLLVAPLHLASTFAHVEKSFIGLLPLVLLALHYALDARRHAAWSLVVAAILLLLLLHNGLQFVLAALSIAFFAIVALMTAKPAERRSLLARITMIALGSLLLAGPQLLAITQVLRHPGIVVDFNLTSEDFQPDLIRFLLPPSFSRVLGAMTWRSLLSYGIAPNVETEVYLTWTALLLCLAALGVGLRRSIGRRSRDIAHLRPLPWLLFTLMWVVLSLGPSLQLFGRRIFTEYQLPIMLPYTLLTALPGMDFLRTPGRLMLVGYVGLGIVACFGLAWLQRRFPRQAFLLTVVAIALLLLETWPRAWPQMAPRPISAFHQQLAADPRSYGVFDLPVQPPAGPEEAREWHVSYSSRFQLEQMTHHKGIANGYISRPYQTHPLFPCLIPDLPPPAADILVNGQPARCYANALFDLAYHDYRYLVWHKPGAGDDYSPEPAEVEELAAFLLSLLAGQRPAFDDALVTVYELPSLEAAAAAAPGVTMGLQHNWYDAEGNSRWAGSPASLFISAPHYQQALLQITAESMKGIEPGEMTATQGKLNIEMDGSFVAQLTLKRGQTASIPLTLTPGIHTVTLTLEAGNFRPSDFGDRDTRLLSFAIRAIDLKLIGD